MPEKSYLHAVEPAIEMVNHAEIGLYVQCLWREDRFHHEIGIINGKQRTRVLSSMEGTAENIWPISPPLQQIHKQEINDNPALLAVGMSGTSHYSTSILLIGVESSIELQIESACCSKIPTEDSTMFLGSRLRVDSEFTNSESSNICLLTRHDSACPTLQVSVDTSCCQLERIGSHELGVIPINVEESGTTQWKYRFRLR